MSDNIFWRNRIVDSGAADPQELAKGYNPDNWRHHPQIQRDALEDALDSIGVLQPVLFNRLSGKVIDGHLRIELAILKGQPLIPVNYVELTDDEEALALATLDAITEQAEPIPDKLAALLLRTREMTADRPGLGAMLERLKERAGINGHQPKEDAGPQIDKAAELQKKWKVKLGDVFELGQHRLVCGDCTDRATVEAVMRGERPGVSFTDPPYNVGVAIGDATNDSRSMASFIEWCKLWLKFMPEKKLLTVGVKNLLWWDQIIGPPQWVMAWVKRNGQGQTGLGGTNKWDPILVYGCPIDNQIDVIEVNNDYSEGIKAGGIHPTSKPVELWVDVLERFGGHTDIIYEPFLGTGTTLIAAHQLNRRCFGIEIEPSYCAVTLERWSQLTGQTPRRVPQGDTKRYERLA